jgi:hypothetical protein
VRYTGGALMPQTAEVDDVRWFSLQEAAERASFARERDVLNQVRQLLEGKLKWAKALPSPILSGWLSPDLYVVLDGVGVGVSGATHHPRPWKPRPRGVKSRDPFCSSCV